jgi:hypothetical protein
MKNPMFILFIFILIVIVISAFFFFGKTKTASLANETIKEVAPNTPFEMSPGETAKMGELTLTYNNLQLPPPSFQGNKDEYTYPQFTALEKEDKYRFALSSQFNSQYYHDYLIRLLERDGEKIKVTIEKAPSTNKIPEYVAVKKALEVAKEANAPMPEARLRILEKNVWKIEMSLGPTDSYMMVEIDAITGEVIKSERQNRV